MQLITVKTRENVQLIHGKHVEKGQLMRYTPTWGDDDGTVSNAGTDSLERQPAQKTIDGMGRAPGWKNISPERPVCADLLCKSACLY